MAVSVLLNPKAAAEFLGVQEQTLAVWRCTGRYSLPFCKVGARMVRYRLADLEKFLADRVVTSTGQAESL